MVEQLIFLAIHCAECDRNNLPMVWCRCCKKMVCYECCINQHQDFKNNFQTICVFFLNLLKSNSGSFPFAVQCWHCQSPLSFKFMNQWSHVFSSKSFLIEYLSCQLLEILIKQRRQRKVAFCNHMRYNCLQLVRCIGIVNNTPQIIKETQTILFSYVLVQITIL